MEDIARLKDEELVFHYIENEDQSAFSELVNRYLKPAYNFSLRLCGNPKDAEEISQESFVKLWKNLGKFRQGEKFKTWFYTIIRNTTIDWMRKKKSILFSEFDNEEGNNYLEDTLIDTEKTAHELFEISEYKTTVEKLLGELTVQYREVLLLRYHEGLDFDEIGKTLKKSINTVKSQHRRALIVLREKMKNAPK